MRFLSCVAPMRSRLAFDTDAGRSARRGRRALFEESPSFGCMSTGALCPLWAMVAEIVGNELPVE